MVKIKIGDKFSKLTVIELIGRRGKSWKCLCDCGNYSKACSSQLLIGHNKSCGCSIRHTTHGLTNTKFYRKWDGIQRRCYRKSYKNFNRYGGRGIKCEWRTFEEFRDDMYESFIKHVKEFGEVDTTIERINPDKNYCRENCKWATWDEQNNNKSSSIFIDYQGIKYTVAQLERKLDLPRIKIQNLLRTRTKEQVIKMIDSGAIFKTSNGKKLELI